MKNPEKSKSGLDIILKYEYIQIFPKGLTVRRYDGIMV
jgi:hypothetical protein